jgi:hypothetical protein
MVNCAVHGVPYGIVYAPDVCIPGHACFMSSNAVVVASPVCTFNKIMMLQIQQGLFTISAVPSCVKLCSIKAGRMQQEYSYIMAEQLSSKNSVYNYIMAIHPCNNRNTILLPRCSCIAAKRDTRLRNSSAAVDLHSHNWAMQLHVCNRSNFASVARRYDIMQLCSYGAMEPGSHAAVQLCSYAVVQLCSYAAMQLCSCAAMHLSQNAAMTPCRHHRTQLCSYACMTPCSYDTLQLAAMQLCIYAASSYAAMQSRSYAAVQLCSCAAMHLYKHICSYQLCSYDTPTVILCSRAVL